MEHPLRCLKLLVRSSLRETGKKRQVIDTLRDHKIRS